MSTILLVGIALLTLIAGYLFYGSRIVKWIGLDLNEATPAVTMNDGVDYVPAKHWAVLFGHHFASIAGAAPIIGPVLACLCWGWLPAVIWIVGGGILFGAVHDYIALVLSVKHKGLSIASVTESVLGKNARIMFSMFAFLALILVVAIFASAAAKTLVAAPQVVAPTFGLIVVAVFIGYLMYHTSTSTAVCTIIGMILLAGLLTLGYFWEITIPVANPVKFWTILLIVYAVIASVVPVTLLLQPRDHLSACILFVGMSAGFIGLAMTRPELQTPAFVKFQSNQGYLWPMLFVTIACGAVSGFHSLVSSGTTSKQLPHMRYAYRIGYGGMIMESALAILAVAAVTAGLYWKAVPEGTSGAVYQDFFKPGGGGALNAFGTGFGAITERLLGKRFGALLGITMLNAFIMTTLDSATRITRYIANELFGETFHLKPMENKYIATIVVGLLAGALALGNPQSVWPIFGSANQLIAGLVFIVATVYLATHQKKITFTAVPAIALFITTIGALTYNIYCFVTGREGDTPLIRVLLSIISIVLIILALFILVTSIKTIRKKRYQPEGEKP